MAVFILFFFLALVTYGLLIDYYRRAWNDITQVKHDLSAETRISVIVAVRNEAEHIATLIGCLKKQDYSRALFEVIIVDDQSEDDTASLVDASFCKVVLLDEQQGKKSAIATGIAKASGELIVTTDADCVMGEQWLRVIARTYEQQDARFIAAPVKMVAGDGILQIFQSLDFMILQGITGASVSKRFHMMCNGANLAYTREAFNEVGGFEGIDTIPSGDDMLLMHKIAMRYPNQVYYLKDVEAVVSTASEKTWGSFFNQRIRWASKAVHYRDRKMLAVLGLTYLVNLFFIAAVVVSFFKAAAIVFFFLFLIAKVVIEFPFANAVAGFFGQRHLMKFFVIMQPLHIIYIVVSGWLGRFGSYTWKKRKIKNI